MDYLLYDLIGIGIGPFNLSMAAIAHDLSELNSLFLDQRPGFDWHPGLLLPTSRMQVPHYADLITPVNPQSRFTFHNYLRSTGNFLRYANQDTTYPLRIEYNRYCQWVASQLSALRFNEQCTRITYNAASRVYTVYTSNNTFHAKHIVLGTGTVPYLPPCLASHGGQQVHHAAHYLFSKQQLLINKRITILGSGQSAAEIFLDLLPHADQLEQLTWMTRSHRFHPMDVSPFTTEMTSMDYIDYFYELDADTKAEVLERQQYLFKGINASVIAQVQDALYIRRANGGKENIRIHTGSEPITATLHANHLQLTCRYRDTGYCFSHETDIVIAATGYQYKPPEFLQDIQQHIEWDTIGNYLVKRNYSIDRHNSLFVLNASLHSHGFNSADLGLGPYRNAMILNAILRREHFKLERNTAFQSFGPPQ